MNDYFQSAKHSPHHAELSGILRESVEEVLREPIRDEEVARALNRARQIAQTTISERPRPARPLASENRILWRVRSEMGRHKRWGIAVATAAALAAGVVLYVSLFSSSMPAYAMEQTARANDQVTSYHVRITPPSSWGSAGEAWVQLALDGVPLHARMDFLGGDWGDRVGIVSESRAEFWWKARHIRVVSDNQRWIDMVLRQCTKLRSLFDPKLAFHKLVADKEAGRVQVATEPPRNQGDPITLTVTSKGDPNRRQVYEIDPQSKLVERVIEYQRCDTQWKRVWKCDYSDYNSEIDPETFQPKLPPDTVTLDPSTVDFGNLARSQGELTDGQMAARLAVECFEAFVNGTFEKTAQLNDVRAAVWKTASTVRSFGREPETITGVEMFLTPSHQRTERTVDGRRVVEICDGRKGKMLTLIPAAKLALILSLENHAVARPYGNTFLDLRNLVAHAERGASKDIERLGVETVDGRRAEGFCIRRGSTELKIWADEKTALPLRVEKVAAFGADEVRTVMSDFQFNVDVDESGFSLDVPAGYTVRRGRVNCAKSPVAHLVDALKLAAEHNSDVFPPSLLGERGLSDILRRAVAALEKQNGKDSPDMFLLREEIAISRNAAFAFLSNLSPDDDWHYAGSDVRLYTPGKPIFWYKPAGNDYYCVVCADLKVKELALEAFQFPFGPPAEPLGADRFAVTFTYRPRKRVQAVYLAGSFNDWKPTAQKMEGPDSEGRFTTRLTLKEGTCEYKFVLDGKTWETDPNNIWQSGNGNSESHVGIPFNSPGKPLGDDRFAVTFNYRPAKKVQAVYLAGSFNDWKPTAHKMDGPDGKGRFTTLLTLKKATHEYKFVLDGKTWAADPGNLWRTGWYQNSLLHIGGQP
jgi:hypothetical protein